VRRTRVTTSLGASGRGFTLAELLVVISIIVLLLVVGVPAFSSILYNNERTAAENALRAGLATARDAAIRADSGDAAAVFIFTPGRGISIVPAVQVGTIDDEEVSGTSPGTRPSVQRDVFVPLPLGEPIQLPRFWSIRGLTPPGTIDNGGDDRNGWYETLSGNAAASNWVFPETPFYDRSSGNSGATRQTFIVRFDNATGQLNTSNRSTALIVDVVPSVQFRNAAPFSTFRFDQAIEPIAAIRRAVAPRSDLTIAQRRTLLGDLSTDTILARPVTELALYDERRMIVGIGGGALNRVSNSVYSYPADPVATAPTPDLDTSLVPGVGAAVDMQRRINEWIEGRRLQGGDPVASDARLFTVQRYLGQAQEVRP
jgi:prepilin-type N-terminal cleavage/methylation domain-containing protein